MRRRDRPANNDSNLLYRYRRKTAAKRNNNNNKSSSIRADVREPRHPERASRRPSVSTNNRGATAARTRGDFNASVRRQRVRSRDIFPDERRITIPSVKHRHTRYSIIHSDVRLGFFFFIHQPIRAQNRCRIDYKILDFNVKCCVFNFFFFFNRPNSSCIQSTNNKKIVN